MVCLSFDKFFGIFVIEKNCYLNYENNFSYVIIGEVFRFFVEVSILFLFLWFTIV